MTTIATESQVIAMLVMAWQRCDATEAELQDYAVRFQQMTYGQADDLIDTWNQLPVTRATAIPVVGLIKQTLPHPPAPTPPLVMRQMPAKYQSTCTICHHQIFTGQPINYIKGFYATHVACGTPTVQSGAYKAPTAAPNPAPTPITATTFTGGTQTFGAPTFRCSFCGTVFATENQHDGHIALIHTRLDQSLVPEPGYYAVTIPVSSENNEMLLRFYRVTKKRNSTYKMFSRMSSDRPVSIDPHEAKLAAAVINAAPQLAMSAYGKLIGHCGCCGHALTDEESRARGIGPECIKKYSNYI